MEEDNGETPLIPLMDGISPNASDADKNLFQLIKTKIIQRAIEQGHDYSPQTGEFRASSMGYCSRKILMYRNKTNYLSQDQIIKMGLLIPDTDELPEPGAHMAGQILHELIQEVLKDDVVGIEEEVSFEFNNLRLVGHYDMLMKDENGDHVVIDIKSTGAKREYLPVQAHLKQLMAYQGMLGGIRGALFYIHRNNWQMTYFAQEYDKNKFSNILTKISDLAIHERNKSLPPIDEDIFENECKNDYYQCDFFDYCFPNYVDPNKMDEIDIDLSENESSQILADNHDKSSKIN